MTTTKRPPGRPAKPAGKPAPRAAPPIRAERPPAPETNVVEPLIEAIAPLLARVREAIAENAERNEKLRGSIQLLDGARPTDTASTRRTLDRLRREEAEIDVSDLDPATRSQALRAFREAHATERAELKRQLDTDGDDDYLRERRAAVNRKIAGLLGEQIDHVSEYESTLNEIVKTALDSIDDYRARYGAAVSVVSAVIAEIGKLAPSPVYCDGTAPAAARRLRGISPISNPKPDRQAEQRAREAIAASIGDVAGAYRYIVERPLGREVESQRGEHIRRNA